MSEPQRSKMMVSPRWLQVAILTFLVGFAILGYLAIRIYQDHPPLPGKVVSESGQTLCTAEDILNGQELFLTYGLMQYGSIYGHGAYLGPDFTADYLHRQALEMVKQYGGDAAAEERVRRELQQNRYDAKTDTLVWSDAQRKAFDTLVDYYSVEMLDRTKSGGGGLGPHAVADP